MVGNQPMIGEEIHVWNGDMEDIIMNINMIGEMIQNSTQIFIRMQETLVLIKLFSELSPILELTILPGGSPKSHITIRDLI